MVVTLGEASLQTSSNVMETPNGNGSYGEAMDVLGNDDSAVKVVKVDQLENHDLGSPL